MRLVVLVALVACGSKPVAPKPKPEPAKELAKQLDEDLAMLGEIAHRQRGNCGATIAELRPHVTRMQQHKTEVDRMLQDAQQAKELKTELAAYATRAGGKSDAIAQDLGATYMACGKECTATCSPVPTAAPQPQPNDAICESSVCKERYQLERAIADMPTY